MADRRGRHGASGDVDRTESSRWTIGGDSTGQSEALAIILSQRERAVVSAAWRFGNREAARDVVQIAMLKAVEGLASVRRLESVASWFHRIVSNVAIDYERHRDAYHRALERMAADASDIEPRRPHEAQCDCLDAALPTLSPSYAGMLRRVDLEERSLREVACHDGLTVNNARVRLHRARRALRRRWVNVCGGSPLKQCVPCGCESRPRSGLETPR